MQTANCRTVKDNRNAECVSAQTHRYGTFILTPAYVFTRKYTHTNTHAHTCTHTHTCELAHTRSTRDFSSQNCGNVLNAFKLLWEIRQMLFAK